MMTTSENVTIDGETGEIVERTVIVDHGDGTATSTTYDGAGDVTGTAELMLPPPAPNDDTVTVTRGDLAAMMQSLRDKIVAELSPVTVNTIAETKEGIITAVSDVADGIAGQLA